MIFKYAFWNNNKDELFYITYSVQEHPSGFTVYKVVRHGWMFFYSKRQKKTIILSLKQMAYGDR